MVVSVSGVQVYVPQHDRPVEEREKDFTKNYKK